MAKASKKSKSGKKSKSNKKSKPSTSRKAAKRSATTKKKVKKKAAPVIATRTAVVHPLNSLLVREVSNHVFRSLSDRKSDAVNTCVNAQMARITHNWNDAGHMDKDYHQNRNSMMAFLSGVRACLQAGNFDFKMNDPALIDACVSAAVYQVKLLVYGRTT
jgi:hypothetical protein